MKRKLVKNCYLNFVSSGNFDVNFPVRITEEVCGAIFLKKS